MWFLDENPPKLNTTGVRNVSRTTLGLDFYQIFRFYLHQIHCIHFYMVKILENEEILQNKVKKITKDQKNFKSSKMLKMYDFHMNFQFRVLYRLPRDLQIAQTYPLQSKWSSTYQGGSRKSMFDFQGSLWITSSGSEPLFEVSELLGPFHPP